MTRSRFAARDALVDALVTQAAGAAVDIGRGSLRTKVRAAKAEIRNESVAQADAERNARIEAARKHDLEFRRMRRSARS